jgi:hypothetical protein
MRQVTATEKYRAVNEGKMAKKEFVRQMRQAYPMYISQYDGFDSTVQILKNRQLLFEAPKKAFSNMKVYDDRPALTYSLDALDRGIRIELQTMGIDMAAQTVKAEEFKQAEKKAKDNLEKDTNHYLNLMAGESNKVDKHDREKEVKRGALDKDTFNDMKKATLKEEVEESIFDTPRMGGFHNSKGVAGHVPNTHKQDKEYADSNRRANNKKDDKTEMSEDAKKNLLGKVVGALRTNYPDITAGVVKDFIKTHYQDLLDGADIEDEFREYISVNYDSLSETEGVDELAGTESVDALTALIGAGGLAGGAVALSKLMDALEDGKFGDRGKAVAKFLRDAGSTFSGQGAPMKEGEVEEKKGKDHDGDGDIDDKDYMAAKDKAIKKAIGKDPKEEQLKEAIKSIIKKTLNEDVLNEAATSRLSQKMEEFGGYNGAQGVINSLENIVTEVESFYGKVRDKIQKVYDDMGNIENEEGLKIGQFIGPSIESAFMQDLRPVTKKGFTQDLQLPKAKQIDPEMLAQARAAGEVDEAPEDPKATVFTPNF